MNHSWPVPHHWRDSSVFPQGCSLRLTRILRSATAPPLSPDPTLALNLNSYAELWTQGVGRFRKRLACRDPSEKIRLMGSVESGNGALDIGRDMWTVAVGTELLCLML